jgi:hypothetical protein
MFAAMESGVRRWTKASRNMNTMCITNLLFILGVLADLLLDDRYR